MVSCVVHISSCNADDIGVFDLFPFNKNMTLLAVGLMISHTPYERLMALSSDNLGVVPGALEARAAYKPCTSDN